jgi:hypothetical protein
MLQNVLLLLLLHKRTGYMRYTAPMPSKISLSRDDSVPAGSRMVWPAATASGFTSGFMLMTWSTVRPAVKQQSNITDCNRVAGNRWQRCSGGTAGKQQCQATGWRCKAQKKTDGDSAAELWGWLQFMLLLWRPGEPARSPKIQGSANRCLEQHWYSKRNMLAPWTAVWTPLLTSLLCNAL